MSNLGSEKYRNTWLQMHMQRCNSEKKKKKERSPGKWPTVFEAAMMASTAPWQSPAHSLCSLVYSVAPPFSQPRSQSLL